MLTEKIDVLGTCVQLSPLTELALIAAGAAIIVVAFAALSRLMPVEKNFHARKDEP